MELAERAQRLHAELVAAQGYATVPATWGEVARQLGVKPTSLERARTRAKQYAAREAS